MKTTKEERKFYRETAARGGFTEGLNLGTVMAILSRDFIERLLGDIDELLAENKRLCTLLEDVENARLEEAELQDYLDSKKGNE